MVVVWVVIKADAIVWLIAFGKESKGADDAEDDGTGLSMELRRTEFKGESKVDMV